MQLLTAGREACEMWFDGSRTCALAALALITPALCSAEPLAPSEALDRYLERGSS